VRIAVLDDGVGPCAGLPPARILHYEVDGTEASPPPAGHHASFCAQLAASAHPQAPGVAPEATILSFNVDGGLGVPDPGLVEEALSIGVVAASAHVVSCSFTIPRANPKLRAACTRLKQHGIPLITAAGDAEGVEAEFGEKVSSISVTAANKNGLLPNLRLGDFVDVAAPGSNLLVQRGATGPIIQWQGLTSGACGVVAGLAAVVLRLADSHDQLVRLGHAFEGLLKATASPIDPEHHICRVHTRALISAARNIVEDL